MSRFSWWTSTVSKVRQLVLYKMAKRWYQRHPKAMVVAISTVGCVALFKLYKRYQSKRMLFDMNEDNDDNDNDKICILITGSDTGFGNTLAHKLNNLGFCAIATCLRDESVQNFNNNARFTKHGSFAIQMDVSDMNSIQNCYQLVSDWLQKDENSNKLLWAIVNNAGFSRLLSFEIYPTQFITDEYKVLLFGPIHVSRTFLPLIYGRNKEFYKNKSNIKIEDIANGSINNNGFANGGRVVTVGSIMPALPPSPGFSAYGVCKAGLNYLSDVIRVELAPMCGVWVCLKYTKNVVHIY